MKKDTNDRLASAAIDMGTEVLLEVMEKVLSQKPNMTLEEFYKILKEGIE